MPHGVIPSLKPLLALGVLGLAYMAAPRAADAGFICAQATTEPSFAEAVVEAGMAPSSSPSEPAPRQNFDERLPTVAHGNPASGMVPSSSSSPTAPVIAAILPDAIQASAQLAAWLGPQGRVWLPPPFSTGIFRPPRSVA